jgi:MFS family permease
MNRVIRLLLWLDGFFFFSVGLLGPIYAIFVEQIGGDILDAGITFAVYSIGIGVFAWIVSRLEDRIKYQPAFLLIGYAIRALGIAGYLFVHSPMQLFLVQAIVAIGIALNSPVYDALFSKNLDRSRAASEWGDWEAMHYITTGVAAIVGAWIADSFGFRALLITMFVVALMSPIILLFYRGRLDEANK